MRATGLPVACGGGELVSFAIRVCPCDATWAETEDTTSRIRAQSRDLDFILPLMNAFLSMRSYDCVLKTGGEKGSPPPQTNAALEGRYGGSIVHFVGFATVALTAELSRLVCADSGRGRVVGCANEEHRRVIAGRQTAL